MDGFAEDRSEEFPLALGSVTGLRAWTLTSPDLRGDPHQADENWPYVPLVGATGFYWPAGALEAVCNNGRSHPPPVLIDPVSGERCGCGFYAYWDVASLGHNQSSSSGLPVIGIVEGFGRTLLGSRGFRCQRAKIIALAPAFSVQADITPRDQNRWNDPYAYRTGGDPYKEVAVEYSKEEVEQRAQQHADAWMAMIQDRLNQSYPDAAVFATVRGMLASMPPRGKPK